MSEGWDGVERGVEVALEVKGPLELALGVDAGENVSPALAPEERVEGGDEEGAIELDAVPLDIRDGDKRDDSVGDKVAPAIEGVIGAEGVEREDRVEDCVGLLDSVASKLCALEKVPNDCDIAEVGDLVPSGGDSEAIEEPEPTPLALVLGVSVLTIEALIVTVGTAEVEATKVPMEAGVELEVGEEEPDESSRRDTVDPGVVEGPTSLVTLAVPAASVAVKLTLGSGQVEADTDALKERVVPWVAEGKALRLDDGEAPHDTLPLGEGEVLLRGDSVKVSLGLLVPLREGRLVLDPPPGVKVTSTAVTEPVYVADETEEAEDSEPEERTDLDVKGDGLELAEGNPTELPLGDLETDGD